MDKLLDLAIVYCLPVIAAVAMVFILRFVAPRTTKGKSAASWVTAFTFIGVLLITMVFLPTRIMPDCPDDTRPDRPTDHGLAGVCGRLMKDYEWSESELQRAAFHYSELDESLARLQFDIPRVRKILEDYSKRVEREVQLLGAWCFHSGVNFGSSVQIDRGDLAIQRHASGQGLYLFGRYNMHDFSSTRLRLDEEGIEFDWESVDQATGLKTSGHTQLKIEIRHEETGRVEELRGSYSLPQNGQEMKGEFWLLRRDQEYTGKPIKISCTDVFGPIEFSQPSLGPRRVE